MGDERVRECVSGFSPDMTARIPADIEFDARDYMVAPDLREIGDKLLRTDRKGLGAIRSAEVSIRWLWRRKGAKSAGKKVLGKCSKVSGIAGFFAESDFVIEVAADYAREFEFTNWQIEALLFHQLQHIGVTWDDETQEWIVSSRGHDVEMFHAEVNEYGLWTFDLKQTARAFEQMPMFAAPPSAPWERERVVVATDEHKHAFETLTSDGGSVTVNGKEIESAEELQAAVATVVGLVTQPEPAALEEPGPSDLATGELIPVEPEKPKRARKKTEPAPDPAPVVEPELRQPTFVTAAADIAGMKEDWKIEFDRQCSLLETMPWKHDEMVDSLDRLATRIDQAHAQGLGERTKMTLECAHLARRFVFESMPETPPEYMAYVLSFVWRQEVHWSPEDGLFRNDNSDAWAAGLVLEEYQRIMSQAAAGVPA